MSYSQNKKQNKTVIVLMTTEVLTPETHCLWTPAETNLSSWCHKKFLTFKETPAKINKTFQSCDKRLPCQATIHLLSLWDRQLMKLQWSDCIPIALIHIKINL